NDLGITATFLAMDAVPFVRQEMIHRREEEGTEAAFLAADRPQRTAREQLREERLRQILRLFRPAPLPPHINVKGIPIRPSQLLQRFRRAENGRVARHEHHAPVRRGEHGWLSGPFSGIKSLSCHELTRLPPSSRNRSLPILTLASETACWCKSRNAPLH